jgi:hypothetical protein
MNTIPRLAPSGASGFFRDIDHEVGDTLDVGKMIHIASRHGVQLHPSWGAAR